MAALSAVLLPGVGGGDRRRTVDVSTAPWSAVARVQVPGMSRCTGVFVTPNLLVTAAHCLTRRGLGHFVEAGSVHILLGYRDGSYTTHLRPDAIILPPGVDPVRTGASLSDFAILHVPRPVAYHVPLQREPIVAGTPLHMAGFNQDRAERLMVDAGCRALGMASSGGQGPFLLHDCDGTRGGSGGPLLAGDPERGFRVVGIQDAALPGQGGIAIPAHVVAALLPP